MIVLMVSLAARPLTQRFDWAWFVSLLLPYLPHFGLGWMTRVKLPVLPSPNR